MSYLKRLFILSTVFSSVAIESQTSQTILSARSFAEDPVLSKALNSLRYEKVDDTVHSSNAHYLSVQGFYQSSTNKSGLSRYFLLDNKAQLQMTGSSGGDLVARWFMADVNDGNMDSKFRIQPQRSVHGANINFHGAFGDEKRNWLNLQLTPMVVRHDLNFEEFDLETLGNGGTVNTIASALNQESFVYGKFSPHILSKEGLDDLVLKIGRSSDREDVNGGCYGMFVVPLGEGAKAEHIFEPLVGSKHWGLGLGGDLDVVLIKKATGNVSFIGNLQYLYRFEGTEKRSFDLKNGQWSRYLSVVRDGEANKVLPGINFFTRDVDVRPKSSLNAVTALHFSNDNFHLEFGYNFWFKNEESVHLKNAWDSSVEKIGIRDQGVSATDKTKSTAKISDVPFSLTEDSTFVRVQASDLNLDSATQKNRVSHKLYTGVTMKTGIFDRNTRIGLGGLVELSSSNRVLHSWGSWINLQNFF